MVFLEREETEQQRIPANATPAMQFAQGQFEKFLFWQILVNALDIAQYVYRDLPFGPAVFVFELADFQEIPLDLISVS